MLEYIQTVNFNNGYLKTQKLEKKNTTKENLYYDHPLYTTASNGFYKVTIDKYGHVSSTTQVTKSDITNLGITDTNTWRPQPDWNATSGDAMIKNKPSSLPANGGNSSTVNGHSVNADVPSGAKFTDTNTWRPQPDWNATSGDAMIKNKPSSLPANGGNSSTVNGHSVNADVPSGAKFTDTNTWRPQPDWNATSGDAMIKNKPSSLPASDVYSWAKASSKPSYTKTEVGLGNVDNTADSNKSVKYATSTGSLISSNDSNLKGKKLYFSDGGSAIYDKNNEIEFYYYNTNKTAWQTVTVSNMMIGLMDCIAKLRGGDNDSNLRITRGNVNRTVPTDQDIVVNGYNGDSINNSPGIGFNMPGRTWGSLKLGSDGAFRFYNGEGNGYLNVYSSGFLQQSSKKYKENIIDMDKEEALKLLELNPVKYNYKNDKDKKDCYGFIAEDVEKIITFPVFYNDNNEVEALDYSKFVPYLVKMVQMQQEEINDLKKEIYELKNKDK